MNNKSDFIQYLTGKKKKQAYIDTSIELLDSLEKMLGDNPPSTDIIDAFVKSRWCGYVSKDRATYQILNDYADFCEKTWTQFTDAFNNHIRETFEGEARKAMKIYKKALVPIPKDTVIAPGFLNGLTNDEFVTAFTHLQQFIRAIYDDIEGGSPFKWGWPGYRAIAAEGINQNRVMMVLSALVNSGHIDNDVLIVDKQCFGGHDICKPVVKAKLMLEGFAKTGLYFNALDNKDKATFTVSCPDIPKLITVLNAYFQRRHDDSSKHVHIFSYRFVEDPLVQDRESFFLAKTDGMPKNLKEIYYWLYDEAIKHGFTPTGNENMGCYSYKKGSKEWLLLGSGSSYHEDEFLHSPNYALAAKPRFHHVFKTHPEKISALKKKFPDSFGRTWTQCWKCKAKSDECKNRVKFELADRDYYHCGRGYLYFHDPDLDDVKAILELYKWENGIYSRSV